jgi:hypothetical protein
MPGVGVKIGEALGRMTKKLSGEIGDQFVNKAKKSVGEASDYRDEAVTKIDRELVEKSLNPEIFRTEEFKKIATEMKERIKHSPEGVSDWFNDTLGGVFEGFYDMLIGIIVPSEIKDFKDAKAASGYLTLLCVDAVVLVAVLDLVATACSVTLIRNVVHIGRLFVATFGLDRYIGTVIAPALNAGLVPQLRYGFNEQYLASIPGPSDLVRMELREVFHPDFRDELLQPPTSTKFKENMRKHGYEDYWSDSYWGAHWVLPSLGNLDEMLHRGIITLSQWQTMVRRNDYLPAWIDKREKIIYKPYTRVDIRRMKDLELVTDAEVLKNYGDLGYDEDHASRMTIWTKAYIISVEMRARYSKGWVTEEDILTELIAAGVPESRAKIWIQRIVKADKEARTVKERDLTKAEIVKGVKEGILEPDDAIEMLVDMGYSHDEAEYILLVNLASITGSPKTWSEFQDLVNLRRKAQGLPVKEIPEEIMDIEKKIMELQEFRKTAEVENKDKKELAKIDEEIEVLEKQHQDLRKTG